jgi:hypothetical protein
MNLAVEGDLAAFEAVDDVKLPEQPGPVDADFMQLAHGGAKLIHRGRGIQRQALDVLAGVGLVVDVQLRDARRRTPQPVIERRAHRALEHALQQLVGKLPRKFAGGAMMARGPML